MAKTTTGERPVSKSREEIVKEAQRIEESLLHSSKRHFEDAALWGRLHLLLGIPTIILAAIVGAAALNQFDPTLFWAGILSVIVTILSAIATFLNPNEKASRHHTVGNKYDALLNQVRLFRSIECWKEPNEEVLYGRLKTYSDEKSKLNESSPTTTIWARWRSQAGIVRGDGAYAVDKDQSQ